MIKFITLIFIAGLVLAISGCTVPGLQKSTATPPAAPGSSSPLAGTWDTDWGAMTFTVAGSHVTGVYTHDNGTIDATLSPDGRSMQGWWYEEPSRLPPNDAGRFFLNLSSDGNSFTGHWGYGEDTSAGNWDGTRAKGTGTGF